jgi:adenylate cyclase class 2
MIALKGPRIHGPTGAYARIELEFEAPDEASIRSQLERQGLIQVAIVDKQRTDYIIDRCVVSIDTLPYIGSFVEIEGPDEESLHAVRIRLGLAHADAVTESYTELLEKRFAISGRPTRPNLVAVFSNGDRA